MSIPFTQFLRPSGARRSVAVSLSPEAEAAARAFMTSGGWFECEELMSGDVRFVACVHDGHEPVDLTEVTCENGPVVIPTLEAFMQSLPTPAAAYEVDGEDEAVNADHE